MIFACDKCGLCCKHLENISQLQHLNSGNGTCIYLNDDNTCSIYNDRPDICNVSKMYKLNFINLMSEEEYIKLNLEGCKEIKRKYLTYK